MKTYEERIAAVEQKLHHKKRSRSMLAATACAVCLCIVIGMFHIPLDKGGDDQYANSEYYKVIQAIKRDYPNIYNIDFSELEEDVVYESDIQPPAASMAPSQDADTDDAEGPNTAQPNGSVEITDHQVAGVLEADIIKRSQTHIFYLNDNTLEVYPIAGLDTTRLSTWCLNADDSTFYYDAQMYLSADATRINLIISGYGNVFAENEKAAFVQVISLDVSDPANIEEANCLYVTGSLLSSRMVGDQMLVMAQYRMDSDIDFEEESTFLPQYGAPGAMQSISADNIVVPEKLTNKTYTVVTLLDGKDMTILDCGAFMSYSTELYVSQGNIYATRGYTAEEEISQTNYINKSMTEISCMAYGEDGLTNRGTFCVEGFVKDQYSMDEHEGVFRIVTATSRREMTKNANGTVSTSGMTKRNANLTCFEVGSWEQTAQVAQFAPDGETVESVRFDGDYAYVCTAVVVTLNDPVFFFDMSDPDNIIVKDTGTIDGYSSSLIQLNGGFLMGIGFDENENLKVEIYEETEAGVESVCAYTNWVSFASKYKAYYIDRENNLLGIPTSGGYILLQFDGYQLHELACVPYASDLNLMRGVVIDQYLYVFIPNGFDVQKIA